MQIYKPFLFILSITVCHVQFGMNNEINEATFDKDAITETDGEIEINPANSADYEEHAQEAWVDSVLADLTQIPMDAEVMQYATVYVCEQCQILLPNIKEHMKLHLELAPDFNASSRRFYRCKNGLCSNAKDGTLIPARLLTQHLAEHEKVATQVTYLISQISGTH